MGRVASASESEEVDRGRRLLREFCECEESRVELQRADRDGDNYWDIEELVQRDAANGPLTVRVAPGHAYNVGTDSSICIRITGSPNGPACSSSQVSADPLTAEFDDVPGSHNGTAFDFQVELGFAARLAPSWGGQATSGAEALWGRETMTGMAHGGLAHGGRLDGEVGYGLPVGSRLVGTPRAGFGRSEYGRDYRIGYGLGVLDRESLSFDLGVDAQRRESPMLARADVGFLGRATLGW